MFRGVRDCCATAGLLPPTRGRRTAASAPFVLVPILISHLKIMSDNEYVAQSLAENGKASFNRLGLHERALVPILMCLACAIALVSAAYTG